MQNPKGGIGVNLLDIQQVRALLILLRMYKIYPGGIPSGKS